MEKINLNVIDLNNEGSSGYVKALVENSYQSLVTLLNSADKKQYEAGQSIYIRTAEVPDIWISANDEATSSTYTYTTDANFISAVNAGGGALQIGYHKVSFLEGPKVDISGYVRTVNSISPTDGNVNITAFSAVPSSMDSYRTGTLENYCREFLTKVNPSQGSAYLTSGIGFSNLPKSFSDHGNPSCEMFIYVPMRSGNNIVYNLEITTTNCFEEQWYGGSGKWMAICQVENGNATLHMPWQGMLGCPQQDSTIDGKHKYVPTEDYHVASKYYVDSTLHKGSNSLESPLVACKQYCLGSISSLALTLPASGTFQDYIWITFTVTAAFTPTVSGTYVGTTVSATTANKSYEYLFTWNGANWVLSILDY